MCDLFSSFYQLRFIFIYLQYAAPFSPLFLLAAVCFSTICNARIFLPHQPQSVFQPLAIRSPTSCGSIFNHEQYANLSSPPGTVYFQSPALSAPPPTHTHQLRFIFNYMQCALPSSSSHISCGSLPSYFAVYLQLSAMRRLFPPLFFTPAAVRMPPPSPPNTLAAIYLQPSTCNLFSITCEGFPPNISCGLHPSCGSYPSCGSHPSHNLHPSSFSPHTSCGLSSTVCNLGLFPPLRSFFNHV